MRIIDCFSLYWAIELLGGALIHQPNRNTGMLRPGFSLVMGFEKTHPLACFQYQRPLAREAAITGCLLYTSPSPRD